MSKQLQLTFDFSEWTEADRMDAAQAAADIRAEYRERKTADNHIDPCKASCEAELRRVPGSNFEGRD